MFGGVLTFPLVVVVVVVVEVVVVVVIKLLLTSLFWLILQFVSVGCDCAASCQLVSTFDVYLGLLWVNGKYLYLIICLIWRFIVIQNNVIKYITNIGQNTGTLKKSKKVQIIAITVLFVIAYQNLNSGNLLINGLNSSLAFVGNSGPSSASKSNAGSIFGVKNAMKRFRWYIPSA